MRAAKDRNRIAAAEHAQDAGGITTDGCLGNHTVRLLHRGDDRHYMIVCDGRHRQPRTYRGVIRCVAEMMARKHRWPK